MRTRNQLQVEKVLHKDYVFRSKSIFPDGKLPTAKDVLQRVLHEDNWTKENTARKIALELVNHWIYCNVYCLYSTSHHSWTQNI